VGSLKKINNLFIKDIFHGYCLKRQSLNRKEAGCAISRRLPPEGWAKPPGTAACPTQRRAPYRRLPAVHTVHRVHFVHNGYPRTRRRRQPGIGPEAELVRLPLPRPTACFNKGYHSGALSEDGSRRRTGTVQPAVADCLAQVRGLDTVVTRQIGDGAGHLEHPVVGPGG